MTILKYLPLALLIGSGLLFISDTESKRMQRAFLALTGSYVVFTIARISELEGEVKRLTKEDSESDRQDDALNQEEPNLY